MRSRFAACVRAPPAPLRGAGAPTRFARRKEAMRGRSDGGEIALYRLRRELRKEPQATKAREMPHGSAQSTPLTPTGFRAASRCLRQGLTTPLCVAF
jgi:hypothetical protein